jgi:hypothetical protein
MDVVKLILLLLLRPQVAVRLIHHRRTEARLMSQMDEEDLLKEHANELECDHHRGKTRTPRRFKMKVR